MKEKTEMLRYSAIIVDDEAIVREGLVKHFDWKKYSIEIKGCFADGTDAWEFLKNQEIDILITDVKMVRMWRNIPISMCCSSVAMGTLII